ncbi:hypothetical protein R5R35_009925 [Gryllus longicercus]
MLTWRCVLLLSLCCGTLLAQTFQYSRGWTNGRKRAGSPVPPGAPGLCGRLQHQRLLLLLSGRATPELLVACGGWRGADLEDSAAPEEYSSLLRPRPDAAGFHDIPRADPEV